MPVEREVDLDVARDVALEVAREVARDVARDVERDAMRLAAFLAADFGATASGASGLLAMIAFCVVARLAINDFFSMCSPPLEICCLMFNP